MLLSAAIAATFLTPSAALAQNVTGKYAALVIDAHTGKQLFSRNSTSLRYPASLTKIMTIYVLFDFLKKGRIKFSDELVVTPFAAGQSPSKIGFKPGESIEVIDAIKALCTKSANDVAVVVAENLAGTESNFARIMTETARRIGMKNTVFKNASGLPDSGQITTARDMVILGARIQEDFPEYYSVFATKRFTYRGKSYRNHNRLLFDYEGTDGIKTGYIRASGFNLVASVRRDDKHLIGVVMGGRSGASRNAHMKEILNASWRKATRDKDQEPLVASVLPWKSEKPERAAASSPVRTVATNPVLAANAALSASDEARGFHVQVGAYDRQSQAEARLKEVSSAAGGLLEDHKPFTMYFQKGSQEYYRARFAGFTKDAASSACETLKQKSINCVVMLAE